MKIVIVGGGIAGCAAYLELKKHLPPPAPGETHSITIYEAYGTKKDTKQHNPDGSPTPSHALVIGGGLAVGPNGLNVVKRLDEDLLRDIVRGGYTLATSNIKNKHGRLLMRMSNAEDRSTPEGGSMHMVGSSRHLLWHCFRQRIPDRDIITKRVVKVVASRDGRNKIYLHGEDDPIDADLVIGADGVKGIVKRALFPDAQEDLYLPHYEYVLPSTWRSSK
jgi:2-polyprenyl-6-methoxyphenol hydroxylase-like FAD-dependent oxidoreductase